MTANASSQQTLSSPDQKTTKSFFQKLTSPLRSRTRNLTDFHIRPADPHRRYSPGDTVKGIVVLSIVKPVRITHITVALHGYVHVYKSPNNVSELTANEANWAQSGSAKRSQYFGNGHASLFQDEVILCGDGRLEVGMYEFEFELEFPKKGLPTSIDFERGTISYVIRATITRPTSIAATSTCDRKISLIESVDVGLLTPPKPRTISLEPISRRSRRTRAKQQTAGSEATETRSSNEDPIRAESPSPDESASQSGSARSDHTAGPVSRSLLNTDGQSEVSGESVVSSSTGLSFRLGPAPSTKSKKSTAGQSNGSNPAASKTITANIELTKGGCLPGDNIPLKISIQHTKRIKSMHGIIVTLYRQGRIDSAPPLELFKDVTGKAAREMKHDEYYPKSKTGLGGLSLSSAGSSSVFRKDLSQTFAPIIINPATLSTIVTASVRVPEDAFPTITGVPGQMISFKYYIEVVVDLGGKLAGQQRHVPRLGMINVPTNFVNGGTTTVERADGPGNMLATWGGSIIETEHIRREKSVVACLFELVVGTTDSQRARRRGNTLSRTVTSDGTIVNTPRSLTFSDTVERQESMDGTTDEMTRATPQHIERGQQQTQSYDRPPEEPYEQYEQSTTAQSAQRQSEPYNLPQVQIPRPETQSDESLTEKQRIQQAEQRLLPSQPPEDEAGPSVYRDHAPSAPALLGDEMQVPNYAEATLTATTPRPQADSLHAQPESSGPSAPPSGDVAIGTEPAHTAPTDDKQELERRRLMAEASSPNDFPEPEDNGEGSSAPSTTDADGPSAPVITEDDEYGGHYASHSHAGPSGAGGLPRYER